MWRAQGGPVRRSNGRRPGGPTPRALHPPLAPRARPAGRMAAAPDRAGRPTSGGRRRGSSAGALRWADAPRRRGPNRIGLLAGLTAAALLVMGGAVVRAELAVDAHVDGLDDGMALSDATAAGTVVRVTTDPADRVEDAVLSLDGLVIGDQARRDGDALLWTVPTGLAEGPHRLTVTVPRAGPLGEVSRTIPFSIDRQPPVVELSPLPPATPIDAPLTVAGSIEPGGSVELDGQVATVAADGRFELVLPHPPAGERHLVATDPAGNAATVPLRAPVAYPSSRGVHVTGAAWSYEPLRRHILQLIESGGIDVVELDLKDEDGIVNYPTGVALAHEIGAVEPYFDLREAVTVLRGRGVRVVGRIVAYRDPTLAEAAWQRGWRDWVVQAPTGQPLDAYGGFTNPAHPDVRRYNLDLALEAVAAGVHDILWDYIRRPEGPLDQLVFPGLQGPVEDAVLALLAEGHGPLRAQGAFQGASVFGVAASRPGDVAQDLGRMARHLDYVAPMVYPSHWSAGEYGVEDPDGQPFEIVQASLADFLRVLAGTGVAVVPWLQDFSLGYDYGAAEVAAQVEAARSLGINSFLLWDPDVTYSADALVPS